MKFHAPKGADKGEFDTLGGKALPLCGQRNRQRYNEAQYGELAMFPHEVTCTKCLVILVRPERTEPSKLTTGAPFIRHATRHDTHQSKGSCLSCGDMKPLVKSDNDLFGERLYCADCYEAESERKQQEEYT